MKIWILWFAIGGLLALTGCTSFFPVSKVPQDSNPNSPPLVLHQKHLDPEVLGEAIIEGDYIEGRLIIGFTDYGALEKLIAIINQKLAEDEDLHGYLEIADYFYIGDLGIALVEVHGLSVPEALGLVIIAVKELDLTDISGAQGIIRPPLQKGQAAERTKPTQRIGGGKFRKKIVFVEPDYAYQLIDPCPRKVDAWTKSLSPDVYDPNADLRSYQWGLDAVHAEGAWAHATGAGITVAVIDTGVDGTHPDLEGKVVEGYDPETGTIIPANADSDTIGHGTHVAGIIAAKDDDKGVVGLAPEAEIMPIVIFKALPGGGYYYVGSYYVALGIIWAVDHGADVLNNSWGGGAYSQVLKAAFDYALANGVVVVDAAGNDGEAFWHYPSAYPGHIAVGASNPHNRKADFSNPGSWLSVVAPGEGVLSCVPTWYIQDGTGQPLLYDYWAGTSMATPFVSALAALLKELHPTASPYQIKKMIEGTAQDIEAPGFDQGTGYGLIQADAATAVSTLPSEGSGLRVHVVTESSPALWGEPRPTVMTDIILRKDGLDIYRGQTDLEGWWYLGYPMGDYWDGWGLGFFPSIEPGTYEILVGGDDCTPWWGNYRTANRVTAKGTVTLSSGDIKTVNVTVNTALKVTVIWGNGEPDTDIDLAIYEPGVGWTFAWWPGFWGNWSSDASGSTGTECYELFVPHYDDAEYYIALYCWSGSADVTVTIEQNSVTETYGPLHVDTTGGYWGSYFFGPGLYLTWDFPGWWDWMWGAWVF